MGAVDVDAAGAKAEEEEEEEEWGGGGPTEALVALSHRAKQPLAAHSIQCLMCEKVWICV